MTLSPAVGRPWLRYQVVHRQAVRSLQGRFGVHAGKEDPLLGHAVDVRRVEPANRFQRRYPEVTERHVIPHNVDDVRTTATVGLKSAEPLADLGVLALPGFTVSGLSQAKLSVVDDRNLAH